MDTTDFTNQIEIENEQEELNESIRMDEEDHNLDHASLTRNKESEQNLNEIAQSTALISQCAREAYKHLYNMGLKTEQIREKLDYLARFLGEFGTSRLSAEQWGHINMWLKELESLQVKL